VTEDAMSGKNEKDIFKFSSQEEKDKFFMDVRVELLARTILSNLMQGYEGDKSIYSFLNYSATCSELSRIIYMFLVKCGLQITENKLRILMNEAAHSVE
jgi:hypothetical protein